MPTKVIVPLLGEGVEEVTIVTWLKSEGEKVGEYDGLVEVETDKVVTEIPSPASGTVLKILEPEAGSAVPVGAILAWIGEAGESIPDQESDAAISTGDRLSPPTPATPVDTPQPVTTADISQPQTVPSPGRVFCTVILYIARPPSPGGLTSLRILVRR